MTPDVTKVKASPDYFIEAEFANGEIRRFDMRPYLDYPAFSALKEEGCLCVLTLSTVLCCGTTKSICRPIRFICGGMVC